MKIKVWSDLHLEFRENLFDHIHIEHPDDKETTLLLAGDIGVGTSAIPFVEEMCKHFKHVLMIHGNHEYYHNDFENVIENWKKWELEEGPDNFHFLYNDWRILDGVQFLGGTMWTSFNNGDVFVMNGARRIMADYRLIKCKGEAIQPVFIKREHDRFMDFLEEKFAEEFNGPTVVMTHHSPGNIQRSRYGSGSMEYLYFAEIEKLVGDANKAKLWVHGHTHQNLDFMINETRVVCNPYGYWGHEVNKEFNRNIVLEV
jgi:predicted phosphodiesterase